MNIALKRDAAQARPKPLYGIPRVAALLRVWTQRYHLSAAETVTLRHAIDGLRREEIAAHRGVSPGTVKHQIGSLLTKVDATNLGEALVAFYRELALGTEEVSV